MWLKGYVYGLFIYQVLIGLEHCCRRALSSVLLALACSSMSLVIHEFERHAVHDNIRTLWSYVWVGAAVVKIR